MKKSKKSEQNEVITVLEKEADKPTIMRSTSSLKQVKKQESKKKKTIKKKNKKQPTAAQIDKQRKVPLKEAAKFRIDGLDKQGGICEYNGSWSNIVYAEQHIFFPMHICDQDWSKSNNTVVVRMKGCNAIEFKIKDAMCVSNDVLAIKYIVAGGEYAPPSSKLALPSLSNNEIRVVCYNQHGDYEHGIVHETSGTITKIDLTPGKEMATYTAETTAGHSGSMVLNPARQVIGFHNEVNGFVPVTPELLTKIRGSKN